MDLNQISLKYFSFYEKFIFSVNKKTNILWVNYKVMKNPLEKPNKTEKPLYICVCSQWIFGQIVTRDVTSTSVLAFVSSMRSPLTSSSLVVCLFVYNLAVYFVTINASNKLWKVCRVRIANCVRAQQFICPMRQLSIFFTDTRNTSNYDQV